MKFGGGVCHDKSAVIALVIMTLISPLLIYISIVYGFDLECGKECYDAENGDGFHADTDPPVCTKTPFPCIERDTGDESGDYTCGCDTLSPSGEGYTKFADQIGPQYCCKASGNISGFFSALINPSDYFSHLKGWQNLATGVTTGKEKHTGRLYYMKPSFYVPMTTSVVLSILLIILGKRASRGIVC